MPPPSLKSLMHSKKKEQSISSSSDSDDEPKRFTSKDSSVSDKQLEQLLMQWSKVKKDILELEEKEKKYKKLISNLMEDDNTDSLFSDTYVVKRRIQKRKTVSQKDLPVDIWERYAKQSEFPVFTLKKI